MPKKYTHLTVAERDKLAAIQDRGKSIRAIARELGRPHCTIVRELRRNGAPINECRYLANRAQKRAEARRQKASRRQRIANRWARHYIVTSLRRGWSPELISGRMRRLRPDEAVSHEAIYQWVYVEARHLISFLVRRHRVRHPRTWMRRSRKTRILGRIHVTERPKATNERRRLGDWEADTIGQRLSRPALQVVVDRKSWYSILNWLLKRNARLMRSALNRSLSRYPAKVRRTITYDNGGENADHLISNAVLGTKSYFCTPYTAQERGTVENTAGLIRRRFPKDTNFGTVSRREVKAVQYWLNHRPRKILGYKTPAEAFRAGGAFRG